MNNVSLMGRLTKDVEVRYSQSATPIAVAVYTLAVPRAYKRQGEPEADFIRCKCFGKTAEFAEKYLKKGHQVGIVGRIEVSNYEDSNKVRKTLVQIIVDNHTFCNNGAAPGTVTMEPNTGFIPNYVEEDDDLPF